MTTLAIVGGGIAGRSVLYALAKEKNRFSEIHLFQSDDFLHSCSLRSTAIVAPRGLSVGHSELGDLLLHGFQVFKDHVGKDSPVGVKKIYQYTANSEKLDEFKKRYPRGEIQNQIASLSLSESLYTAKDEAFMVEPEIYLHWLLSEAQKNMRVQLVQDFVTEVQETNEIKTANGLSLRFDKIVMAGGVGNQYWKQKGKPVQGCYLEFDSPNWGSEGFSLTLNGDNLIYHPHKKLLIGSTTEDTNHELSPHFELREIHQRLQKFLQIKLPTFETGNVIVGLRDKASKRMPYLNESKDIIFLGGYYKNGFTLSHVMGNKVVQKL